MSTKKPIGKLDVNKETLRELVDLSQVHGADGEEAAVIKVSKNGKGGSVSLFMCCCNNNA